jgi:hypothetical protein
MYKYICNDCGAISYSSTKEVNVPCPVCKSINCSVIESNKNKLLDALSNFQIALFQLVSEIEKAYCEEIVAKDYPFTKSLKEVYFDVIKWTDTINNELK